jgi:xylulokinase
MESIGIKPSVIRAGNANMFLSPVFREALASTVGATIELYDTDGAQGAALAGGMGAGVYKSFGEAFQHLQKLGTIDPNPAKAGEYAEAYQKWVGQLNKILP